MAGKESDTVIKSVGFSPRNPVEAKMLKAFKRKRNFSRYVKGLIAEDLGLKEPKKKTRQSEPQPEIEPVPESSSQNEPTDASHSSQPDTLPEPIKKPGSVWRPS